VTQQNAALVEQAAAATESLKVQAHQLSEAIAVFRFDGVMPETPARALPRLARGG